MTDISVVHLPDLARGQQVSNFIEHITNN